MNKTILIPTFDTIVNKSKLLNDTKKEQIEIELEELSELYKMLIAGKIDSKLTEEIKQRYLELKEKHENNT